MGVCRSYESRRGDAMLFPRIESRDSREVGLGLRWSLFPRRRDNRGIFSRDRSVRESKRVWLFLTECRSFLIECVSLFLERIALSESVGRSFQLCVSLLPIGRSLFLIKYRSFLEERSRYWRERSLFLREERVERIKIRRELRESNRIENR